MKKAIIYQSKSGSVKKCAQLLQSKLEGFSTIDLGQERAKINLSDYDFIVFGGAFYADSFSGKVKRLIKKNKKLLQEKPFAIYVCSVRDKNYQKTLAKSIGHKVVEKAIITSHFGYTVDSSQGNAINRFVSRILEKALPKENMPLANLQEEKIEEFARAIEKQM